MSYEKGAIIAAPGHDTHDFELIKIYGLPMI